MDDTQIKSKLRFILRQADGGKIPKKVPMTPELIKLVDENTAQKIYNELINELGISKDDLI